jgi:hypothetical protein
MQTTIYGNTLKILKTNDNLLESHEISNKNQTTKKADFCKFMTQPRRILSDEEWYELGCRQGRMRDCIWKLQCDIHARFGKSHTFAKTVSNLGQQIAVFASGNLDDGCYEDLRRSGRDELILPCLPDGKLRSTYVFYNIGRTDEGRYYDACDLRPYPKNLTTALADKFDRTISDVVAMYMRPESPANQFLKRKILLMMERTIASLKTWRRERICVVNE